MPAARIAAVGSLRAIYSLGIGLLWDPSPNLHAEFYWGLPLKEVDNVGDSIQDIGIHFRVVWRTRA